MARTISHLFAMLNREILFLPLKHKIIIHIFLPPCNILYLIDYKYQFANNSTYMQCSCVENVIVNRWLCELQQKLLTWEESRNKAVLPIYVGYMITIMIMIINDNDNDNDIMTMSLWQWQWQFYDNDNDNQLFHLFYLFQHLHICISFAIA